MFKWARCLDGTTINLTRIDGFILGQIHKHDVEGKPMFEPDGTTPIQDLCVFGIAGNIQGPIKVVDNFDQGQLVIQSILADMKKDYDKENNNIQVATVEEKKILKMG